MRDINWLHNLLDTTWDAYFSDVPQENIVRIEFGRRTKNRLGSIRVDPRDPQISIITMNGLFRHEAVPEFVAQATLVHELCHYAHGFNSPIEQKFRHPHAGGVMRREFRERGLEGLYLEQRRWLKANWPGVVAEHLPNQARLRVSSKPSRIPKPFWFS